MTTIHRYPPGSIVTALVPPESRLHQGVSIHRDNGEPSRRDCMVVRFTGWHDYYWLHVLGTNNRDWTIGRYVMASETEIGDAR